MARNLWSDRPLGVKLAALVAAGGLSLGVLSVVAVENFHRTGERTDVLLDTTHATAAALEADMMHDAVRGDVLQALLNNSGPLYESAVADLDGHSAHFRSAVRVAVRGPGWELAPLPEAPGRDLRRRLGCRRPRAVRAGLPRGRGVPGPRRRDGRPRRDHRACGREVLPGFLEAFTALE